MCVCNVKFGKDFDVKLIHHDLVFRPLISSVLGGVRHVTHFRMVFLFDTHSHLPPLASLIALSLCQTSEQMNSSMTALQAEKERLMRSVSEKEAELSSLRQASQVQQSSLQQERERSSRELGELQGKLQEKVSQDSRAELSSVNSRKLSTQYI